MKRYYFSIITEPPKNVVSSQVIEYLHMLEDKDMVFNVNFFIKIGDYLRLRKSIKEFKKEMQNKLDGKISIYPAFRSKDRLGLYIATAILYIKLLLHFNEKIVIHARGSFGAIIAAKLKKIRKNVSFIYDVRADSAAEFKFTAEKRNAPQEEIDAFIKDQEKIQGYLTKRASHVFCVSSVLKSRVMETSTAKEDKFTIIPCLADSRKFYYDEEERKALRSELGVNDKYVFIYTGGTGEWHYTDEVYRKVGHILKKYENTFFLILTPDVDAANELASKLLPTGRYFIKSASHDEVPKYMRAADMGLLLRERHPLNEVASPTKFAEYAMSGLPIIISEGIGDYSSFVKEHKTGIVVDNSESLEEFEKLVTPYILKNGSLNKSNISELGTKNFSKQKYIQEMGRIYKTI